MMKGRVVKIIAIAAIIILIILLAGLMLDNGETSPEEGFRRENFAENSNASSTENMAVANELLRLLGNLEKLRFDSTLFEDPAFIALVDWSRPIPTQNPGRNNPFRPIELDPMTRALGQGSTTLPVVRIVNQATTSPN